MELAPAHDEVAALKQIRDNEAKKQEQLSDQEFSSAAWQAVNEPARFGTESLRRNISEPSGYIDLGEDSTSHPNTGWQSIRSDNIDGQSVELCSRVIRIVKTDAETAQKRYELTLQTMRRLRDDNGNYFNLDSQDLLTLASEWFSPNLPNADKPRLKQLKQSHIVLAKALGMTGGELDLDSKDPDQTLLNELHDVDEIILKPTIDAYAHPYVMC